MMSIKQPRLLIFILFISLFGFSVKVNAQTETTSVPAVELDPDVAVKWMELLYDQVEAQGISAPAASRLYAYAGVTVYQAILPGMPTSFSLSGQLNDLPDTPYADENEVYDWASSANAALATVLSGILPKESSRAISTLRQSQTAAREREVDEDVVARSLKFGDEVGKVILNWVAGDNYAQTRDLVWEMPTGYPSYWVYTREGQKAVEPFWGEIRPFALSDADACAVDSTMPFSSEEDSTFYIQALEVKNVGDNLTDEQKDIARFWVDTPGETGTPAGHWVLIENQLVDLLDLTLERAAHMYALVGVALGDSFISAWSLKYQLNLLRPITYIQTYIEPNWNSLIASPGFPEYPSGHSVVSGAAGDVLTYLFGTVAFTDRSGRKHGLDDRSFTSFQAAASEAAISRLYGGIHFRAAIEGGLRQGQCISDSIKNYLQLRSIPQGE
jgi:PAP2 superfamily